MNATLETLDRRARHYFDVAFRLIVKRMFPLWESLGLHVTPVHFYEPIPDTRKLTPSNWHPSALVGIDLREEAALELLSHFEAAYKAEYDAFPADPTAVRHQFYRNNRSFTPCDAEVLYCMVRHFKPRRILEVGSGYSTLAAAQAVRDNAKGGHACELVACEPYPSELLLEGFEGLSRLVRHGVQTVPLAEFEALGENDILFIDSSHVLKIGSDVQYEFLEVFPRLRPGVIVHVHDIFLPAEYHPDWVLKNHIFWNEQYLLQAFLMFNAAFEVLWPASALHMHHPDRLEQAFAHYGRSTHWPGSFWMRKTT